MIRKFGILVVAFPQKRSGSNMRACSCEQRTFDQITRGQPGTPIVCSNCEGIVLCDFCEGSSRTAACIVLTNNTYACSAHKGIAEEQLAGSK